MAQHTELASVSPPLPYSQLGRRMRRRRRRRSNSSSLFFFFVLLLFASDMHPMDPVARGKIQLEKTPPVWTIPFSVLRVHRSSGPFAIAACRMPQIKCKGDGSGTRVPWWCGTYFLGFYKPQIPRQRCRKLVVLVLPYPHRVVVGGGSV